MATPFNARPYKVFLCDAAREGTGFADTLHAWLTVAGVPTWYERNQDISAAAIDQAIDASQAAVILATKGSADVLRTAATRLTEERARHRDYRIAVVRLDDDAPATLNAAVRIEAHGGAWTAEAASLLVAALFGGGEPSGAHAAYLCRSWKEEDAPRGAALARAMLAAGLRPVCDWPDHANYDRARVARLIDGCGALVALLPHRGGGATSKYMLSEIETARAAAIPVLAFAEPGVALPPSVGFDARPAPADPAHGWGADLEDLALDWKDPGSGQHVFIGHSHAVEGKFAALRDMIARVSGLPVVIGRMVDGLDVPKEIVRDIQRAEFCLFDITNKDYPNLPAKIDFALNSCIEAGIAMGAGKTIYLTCAGPERSPPFMLRSAQVRYYEDDAGLVAHVARACVKHRRLIVQ